MTLTLVWVNMASRDDMQEPSPVALVLAVRSTNVRSNPRSSPLSFILPHRNYIMSKRKADTKPTNGHENGLEEAKVAALQQYQATEGHFSLVRYAFIWTSTWRRLR